MSGKTGSQHRSAPAPAALRAITCRAIACPLCTISGRSRRSFPWRGVQRD